MDKTSIERLAVDDLIIEARMTSVRRLVTVEELGDRIIGRLELDGAEACVEVRMRGDTLTGIHASCAGLIIDGPYKQVHELLGRPMLSSMSDVVRALTVRILGIMIGMERMVAAAAAVRTFIVRGGLTERHSRSLPDALRATKGLFDASLECSQGCMLDAYQTRLLRAAWEALGAGEDYDIQAGINEGRFEYYMVRRIMPELDDIAAFIEGDC